MEPPPYRILGEYIQRSRAGVRLGEVPFVQNVNALLPRGTPQLSIDKLAAIERGENEPLPDWVSPMAYTLGVESIELERRSVALPFGIPPASPEDVERNRPLVAALDALARRPEQEQRDAYERLRRILDP